MGQEERNLREKGYRRHVDSVWVKVRLGIVLGVAACGVVGASLILSVHQPIVRAVGDLFVIAVVTLFLNVYIWYNRDRGQSRKTRSRITRDADAHEYAKDLGLFAAHPAILETLPPLETLGTPESSSRTTVETIAASFDMQLELIRQALDLTSVVVLLPDPEGHNLRLRSLATVREDISPGPYPVGSGIAGALLRAGDEIAVAPVTHDFAGLPYYRTNGGVGSLLALRLPDEYPPESGGSEKKISGILCVDRTLESEWSGPERMFLRLAARKLSLDATMGRRLHHMDRERRTIQRVCIGLRELNRGLGLEQAFDAAIAAIRALVETDFVAISLVNGGNHRIERVEGVYAERLSGREFPVEEGLVGQVIKFKRPLPAGGVYRDSAPIFSAKERFSEFESLLVTPLLNEEGEALGALSVASRQPGVFPRHREDILSLIAAQVAIKINLAQAHEQIHRMATTDGLTNLTNRRALRHGFDIMIHRATRRSGPLCFILSDIDHFKNVNDTYGHPFGDQVLKSVAATLANAVRKVDLVARYGGEEFAVVLEDSDERGGREMAERIRCAVEDLKLKHGKEEVRITMSLGVAAFPKDGEEKSILMSHADQALYHAKNSGRNRIAIWSELGE